MHISRQLQKWVTVYSALISKEKHGAHVTVGGVVKDFNVINIEGEDPTCFMVLDDGVGETTVMLPPDVYSHYESDFIEGDLITVKGRVFVINNPQSKKKEVKVIGYSVDKPELVKA